MSPATPASACQTRPPTPPGSARPASDRWKHGDRVAVLDRRGQPAEEPYVLVVEVYVDEAAQTARIVDQAAAEPSVARVEVGEQRVERVTRPLYRLRAPGERAQDRRDPDFDGHR